MNSDSPVRTLIRSLIAAPFWVGARSGIWLAVYLCLCGGVAAATFWALRLHSDAIVPALNEYLFPKSWHFATKHMFEMVAERIPADVFANAMALVALQLIAILLFPLKEAASAAFERELDLMPGSPKEHPLYRQAWDESKLLLVNVTALMVIGTLGYQPEEALKKVAIGLGYLQLAFFFSIDYLAPVFQRHRGDYGQVLRLWFAHPWLCLVFGIWFVFPQIWVGHLAKNSAFQIDTIAFLMIVAQVIPIGLAVLSGTWFGAKMMGQIEKDRPFPVFLRGAFWTATLVVFCGHGIVYAGVGESLHHKSQIFKCNYTLDLDSIRPQVHSWKDLLNLNIDVGLAFDVVIENPTPYDVQIEKNRLEVSVGERRLDAPSLPEIRVLSGQRILHHVDLRFTWTRAELGALADSAWAQVVAISKRLGNAVFGDDSLESIQRDVTKRVESWAQGLRVVLYLEVFEGVEFPFYLVTPKPR